MGENLSENKDRFYLDPRAVIEAYKYSELEDYDVVTLIHTHKYGFEPSNLDLEGMKLWPIPWIIIDEYNCEARAWIRDEGGLRELDTRYLLLF